MLLVLLLCLITLSSSFISAQCPANVDSIIIFNDRTINVPLTVPLCLQCRFFNDHGNFILFSDGVWRKDSTVLNNGNFSGNVSITSTSNATALTLNYPDAVVNVGDTLTCSSSSASRQNIITIGAFDFFNPIVFPNGTVNVTEGSNLTLTCSDPGNAGAPRYVWIRDDSQLTAVVNSPPLSLQLTNITRNNSGNYTCQLSTTDLPGVYRYSTVAVDVFYLDIASDLVTKRLPVDSNHTVRCSFYSSPMIDSVIWSHNGTELNPNNTPHISIITHSTYSELILSPLQWLNDSGEYTCAVSNGVINDSKVLLDLIIQIRPAPVYNLAAPESDITNTSIRLNWSLGFDGYSSLTGGILSYVAVFNGEGSGVIPFTGASVMGIIVSSLQPYTGYNFSVIVTNGIGNSSTETIFAKTLSNSPSAPTLNSVLAFSSTFLFATWSDNRDPLTQQPVHTYRVVYYENGQNYHSTRNTTDTNLTIHNLSKGASYSVLVYAINAIGASEPSNIITTVTSDDGLSTNKSVSLSLGMIVLVFNVICTVLVIATVTFGISYYCFKRKKKVIESNVDLQEYVKSSAQATTLMHDELSDTGVTGMQANASCISTTVPQPGQMNLIGSTHQPTQSNPAYQPSASADKSIHEALQDDTPDDYENMEDYVNI